MLIYQQAESPETVKNIIRFISNNFYFKFNFLFFKFDQI